MRSIYGVVAVRAVASLLLVSGTAVTARAQAWVPAKGEGTVSVLFTNVLSKDHYLPDEPVDFGHIDSNTVLFDVTYGVSDRLAVTAGLPVVMSRYRGNAPHRPITLDDGAWHTTSQDFRFAVRYSVVRGPVDGDAVHRHGSPECGLRVLRARGPGSATEGAQCRRRRGPAVSRTSGWWCRAATRSRSRKARSISRGATALRRWRARISSTPSIRLLAMTSSRIGHTGIDLAPDSGRVLPPEVFRHHDQISRESYLNIGGGAAFSVTDTWDLFGSFTTTVTGRNTHAVNRGISLGVALELRRPRRPDPRVTGCAARAGSSSVSVRRPGTRAAFTSM